MKARQKRLIFVLLALVGIAIAATLIINALKSNLAYYYPPKEVIAGKAPINELIRVGGMVKIGSLKRSDKDLKIEFVVHDMKGSEITIIHEGILPDLFKEGQGTIAKGKLSKDNIFYAEEVLAKHDEKYMPPEVADTIKAEIK